MSIVNDYAEAALVERDEDDREPDSDVCARISFSTFVLRVPSPSDN